MRPIGQSGLVGERGKVGSSCDVLSTLLFPAHYDDCCLFAREHVVRTEQAGVTVAFEQAFGVCPSNGLREPVVFGHVSERNVFLRRRVAFGIPEHRCQLSAGDGAVRLHAARVADALEDTVENRPVNAFVIPLRRVDVGEAIRRAKLKRSDRRGELADRDGGAGSTESVACLYGIDAVGEGARETVVSGVAAVQPFDGFVLGAVGGGGANGLKSGCRLAFVGHEDKGTFHAEDDALGSTFKDDFVRERQVVCGVGPHGHEIFAAEIVLGIAEHAALKGADGRIEDDRVVAPLLFESPERNGELGALGSEGRVSSERQGAAVLDAAYGLVRDNVDAHGRLGVVSQCCDGRVGYRQIAVHAKCHAARADAFGAQVGVLDEHASGDIHDDSFARHAHARPVDDLKTAVRGDRPVDRVDVRGELGVGDGRHALEDGARAFDDDLVGDVGDHGLALDVQGAPVEHGIFDAEFHEACIGDVEAAFGAQSVFAADGRDGGVGIDDDIAARDDAFGPEIVGGINGCCGDVELDRTDSQVAFAPDTPAQVPVGDDFKAGGRVAGDGQVALRLDAREIQLFARCGIKGDGVLAYQMDRRAVRHDDGRACGVCGNMDVCVRERQRA